MNTTTETYTPGHTPNLFGHTASPTAFMAARDLESHGFFLTPLLQPGFNVLDAGCGPGTITAGIAESVFPGRVTAIDNATSQLKLARRLTEGREIVNAHFLQASVYDIPCADASFDLVFSHALFEHLSAPAAALRELHRVTRPGGFAALCSPDWNAFELHPFPLPVRRALEAYRSLQESNGGNPSAGTQLGKWLTGAGFTLLSENEWVEEYEDPRRIAGYLAHQLDTAGRQNHATTLRDWAGCEDASFRQNWKYAIAVRADNFVQHRIFAE